MPQVDWKVAAVIVAGGALLIWYLDRRIGQGITAAGNAVKDTATALNPVNKDNIFSQGVNAVTNAIANPAGAAHQVTFGEEIFAWIHPDQYQQLQAMQTQ